LKEYGDKVSEQEKNAIEADLNTLKEAVAGDDLEKIKSGLEALTQSSMKLGEAMYKEQQQETGQQGAADGSDDSSDVKSEKVVDAEFEEVKEEDSKEA